MLSVGLVGVSAAGRSVPVDDISEAYSERTPRNESGGWFGMGGRWGGREGCNPSELPAQGFPLSLALTRTLARGDM